MPFEYEIGHDKIRGYDTGEEIIQFVKTSKAIREINSFIKSVTAYGDNVEYNDKEFSTFSFSVFGDYFVKVEAFIDNDGRYYIYKKIKIIDIVKDDFDFCDDELKNFGYPLKDYYGVDFWNEYRFCLLMALSNERVPVFVVTDENEKIVNGVKSAFATFNRAITKRSTCIDAIGNIPKIKADVIVCRCFSKDDNKTFIREIKTYNEMILLHFNEGKAKCNVKIERPSYCSKVLQILRSKESDLNNLISDFVEATLKADQYGAVYKNNGEFYNLAAYILLKDRQSTLLESVCASQQEIDAIERILNSGGV